MKSKIFLILTILWMGVIFFFSSKPAEESTDMSMSVGRFFAHIFVPGYDDWPIEEQYEFAEKIDHPVRKTAHATEYAILGFLIYGILWSSKKIEKNKMKILCAIMIGGFYAMTDEFHQIFVEGRAGLFTDVLIDTAGVILGVFIMLGIKKLINKVKG